MCMFVPHLPQATLLFEAAARPCCIRNKTASIVVTCHYRVSTTTVQKKHALTNKTWSNLNMTYVCDMKSNGIKYLSKI